ncbi:unnamed protein product [Lymnaea stagnalis]|uniref:Protein sleepless n=1 Tax=Lymnaea stagnalis TaxID=6523 RepID=A0AAV2HWF9_LYMST
MSSTRRLAVSIIYIAIAFIPATVALKCYQCGDTIDNGSCNTDVKGLLDTAMGKTDLYKQDCTESRSEWKYCMIETAKERGHYTLYHRGCHDGSNFTFKGDRFQGIAPNNETTCEQVEARFVCYSLCETDYCNGPQLPDCNDTLLREQFYGEECGSRAIFSMPLAVIFNMFCLILTLVYFGAL